MKCTVYKSFLIHISTRYPAEAVSRNRHPSGQLQHIFAIYLHIAPPFLCSCYMSWLPYHKMYAVSTSFPIADITVPTQKSNCDSEAEG